MVKSATVMEREVREHLRGGTGSVEIRHVFRQEELGGGAHALENRGAEPLELMAVILRR